MSRSSHRVNLARRNRQAPRRIPDSRRRPQLRAISLNTRTFAGKSRARSNQKKSPLPALHVLRSAHASAGFVLTALRAVTSDRAGAAQVVACRRTAIMRGLADERQEVRRAA